MSVSPSIDQVVTHCMEAHADDLHAALVGELVAREQHLVEWLQVEATRLGTFPELVAYKIAEAGLGEPLSEAHMRLLKANFDTTIARLAAMFGDEDN